MEELGTRWENTFFKSVFKVLVSRDIRNEIAKNSTCICCHNTWYHFRVTLLIFRFNLTSILKKFKSFFNLRI